MSVRPFVHSFGPVSSLGNLRGPIGHFLLHTFTQMFTHTLTHIFTLILTHVYTYVYTYVYTFVNTNVSIITADIDNMYRKIPLELSNQGVVEYCNSRTTPDEVTTNEIVEGLKIWQKNNVFEFKGQLYKQTVGHATGQKQIPPVACSGAGIVERKSLNLPRDIVFDSGTK
jgi:hypothetical protein